MEQRKQRGKVYALNQREDANYTSGRFYAIKGTVRVSCSRNPQVTLVEKPQFKIISFPNFNIDIQFILYQTMLLRVPL